MTPTVPRVQQHPVQGPSRGKDADPGATKRYNGDYWTPQSGSSGRSCAAGGPRMEQYERLIPPGDSSEADGVGDCGRGAHVER